MTWSRKHQDCIRITSALSLSREHSQVLCHLRRSSIPIIISIPVVEGSPFNPDDSRHWVSLWKHSNKHKREENTAREVIRREPGHTHVFLTPEEERTTEEMISRCSKSRSTCLCRIQSLRSNSKTLDIEEEEKVESTQRTLFLSITSFTRCYSFFSISLSSSLFYRQNKGRSSLLTSPFLPMKSLVS